MKIRTFLLFACMIVVPMLAMFSHKIPPDFRQAARHHFWDPAQRAMTGGEAAAVPAVVASMPTVTISETVAPADPQPSFADSGLAPAVPTRAAVSPPASMREIEGRLAALGGFAVECVPVTGDGGIHHCSCRVAADPSGQLQRVFQSSGRDSAAAMQQLLEQVQAWKERIAVSPTSTPARRF